MFQQDYGGREVNVEEEIIYLNLLSVGNLIAMITDMMTNFILLFLWWYNYSPGTLLPFLYKLRVGSTM